MRTNYKNLIKTSHYLMFIGKKKLTYVDEGAMDTRFPLLVPTHCKCRKGESKKQNSEALATSCTSARNSTMMSSDHSSYKLSASNMSKL